jgi:hypothetical protein
MARDKDFLMHVMMRGTTTLLLLVLLCCRTGFTTNPEIEEEELRARDFIQLLNKKTEEQNNRLTLAHWAYASNITDANLQHQVGLLKITKLC